MKRTPRDQSRRNGTPEASGGCAVPAGGALGWQAAPMFTSGRITYEVGGNVDATAYGGFAAMHRLVIASRSVDSAAWCVSAAGSLPFGHRMAAAWLYNWISPGHRQPRSRQ